MQQNWRRRQQILVAQFKSLTSLHRGEATHHQGLCLAYVTVTHLQCCTAIKRSSRIISDNNALAVSQDSSGRVGTNQTLQKLSKYQAWLHSHSVHPRNELAAKKSKDNTADDLNPVRWGHPLVTHSPVGPSCPRGTGGAPPVN